MRGWCTFWNDAKRFGFVVSDRGLSYYVSQFDLKGATRLIKDEEVSFSPSAGKGGQGPRATNVRPVQCVKLS